MGHFTDSLFKDLACNETKSTAALDTTNHAFQALNKLSQDLTPLEQQYKNFFWVHAKEGRLYDKFFHIAFDNELTSLGLMDLFNADGLLANSGTYGRIKQARAANPNSPALQALLKFWVLQFKDHAPTQTQLQRKKQQEANKRRDALQAQRVRREQEAQKQLAQALANYQVLDDNFIVIKDQVDKIASDYTKRKGSILLPKLQQAADYRAKIMAMSRNIIRSNQHTEQSAIQSLKSGNNAIAVKLSLSPQPKLRHTSTYIRVEVESFFGCYPNFHLQDKTASSSTYISAQDYLNAQVKSKVQILFDNIWEVVGRILNTLPRVKAKYNDLQAILTMSANAQTAVDSGKPVDPEFINLILDKIAKGKAKASRAYDSWAGSQDGSQGAAQHIAISEATQQIALYLLKCNWRAIIDGKQIVSWRNTESTDSLLDSIFQVVRLYNDTLQIQILK